jgi:hypothetical protein
MKDKATSAIADEIIRRAQEIERLRGLLVRWMDEWLDDDAPSDALIADTAMALSGRATE